MAPLAAALAAACRGTCRTEGDQSRSPSVKPLILATVDRARSLIPLPAGMLTRARLIAGKLPVPDADLDGRIAESGWHRRIVPVDGAVLDIGAGHDLLTAVWLAMSVRCRVTAVDLERYAVPTLVADTVQRVRRRLGFGPDAEIAARRGAAFWSLLRDRYRVDYRAPVGAGGWGGGYAAVISTAVFEHIPEDDLGPVLERCRQALAPGGRFSAIIDYRDHWSYRSDGRGVYDFLAEEGLRWRWLNHRSMHQNRLRHDDHRARLGAAGFGVTAEEVEGPSTDDLAVLARLRLPDGLRGRDPQRLGIRVGRIHAAVGG